MPGVFTVLADAPVEVAPSKRMLEFRNPRRSAATQSLDNMNGRYRVQTDFMKRSAIATKPVSRCLSLDCPYRLRSSPELNRVEPTASSP